MLFVPLSKHKCAHIIDRQQIRLALKFIKRNQRSTVFFFEHLAQSVLHQVYLCISECCVYPQTKLNEAHSHLWLLNNNKLSQQKVNAIAIATDRNLDESEKHATALAGLVVAAAAISR